MAAPSETHNFVCKIKNDCKKSRSFIYFDVGKGESMLFWRNDNNYHPTKMLEHMHSLI